MLSFSNVARNQTFKCMCCIEVSSTGPVLRGVLKLFLFAPFRQCKEKPWNIVYDPALEGLMHRCSAFV